MGNIAVAGDLAGVEELDELYRLDASEPEPEGDEGDADEAEAEDDDEGMKPDVVPHG